MNTHEDALEEYRECMRHICRIIQAAAAIEHMVRFGLLSQYDDPRIHGRRLVTEEYLDGGLEALQCAVEAITKGLRALHGTVCHRVEIKAVQNGNYEIIG